MSKTWTQRMADKLERATYIMPIIKMPVVFDTPSTPPYSALVMPSQAYERGLTFEEAIAYFIRYGYPPRDNGQACVYDADGVIVIGWYRNDEMDDATAWYGTRAGYEMLGRSPLVDPLQLALAIEQANQQPWV